MVAQLTQRQKNQHLKKFLHSAGQISWEVLHLKNVFQSLILAIEDDVIVRLLVHIHIIYRTIFSVLSHCDTKDKDR